MKKLLFLILIVSLFIFCCKEKPKPEYFIDQDTKDFCVFKVGSWWIYEKEGSAEKDCVWVTQSFEKKIGSNDRGNNTGNIRKGYQMILFSTFWQMQAVQITCWAGGDESFPDKNIFTELITFPLALEDNTFLSTTDTFVKFVPYFGYKFQLFDTLSTYSIGANKYNDVKSFIVNKGLHQYWQKRIYWARHIGKIRYERGDGTIWNLINYKVEQ